MNNNEPSPDQIADKLLAYLRVTLNNPNINYDIPPTPILGGYEAFTYHFKLTGVPSGLTGPQVLRLFQPYRSPDQAIRESAVQNVLAAQEYPAPTVHFTGTDKTHLGGAFLIMDFLPGKTMLAVADDDMPSMLGKAHAALHTIDTTPLIKTLQAQGFAEQHHRLRGRLRGLTARAKIFPWLAESVQWLIDNQPPEPDYLAICHGDFHPLNILVNDGKVTAVLDWPGFMIGDASLDVAFTLVLSTTVARHLLPGQNWDDIMAKYLAAYRSERLLDETHLDYYQMLRCIIAFVDGAEGQAAWTSPPILSSLIDHVHYLTQIHVALPDRQTECD